MAINDKEKGMKQKRGIKKVFNIFFKTEQFDKIIEIGTGSGYFSLYILEKAVEMEALFYTFDVKKISGGMEKRLYDLGGVFFNENVNKNNRIQDMLRNGRILLLNDGGLKVPQFKKYTPLLKKGDCILTHDYYKNQKIPRKGVITLDEAKPYIKNNGLEVMYEKLFDEFLWLCCVKM